MFIEKRSTRQPDPSGVEASGYDRGGRGDGGGVKWLESRGLTRDFLSQFLMPASVAGGEAV